MFDAYFEWLSTCIICHRVADKYLCPYILFAISFYRDWKRVLDLWYTGYSFIRNYAFYILQDYTIIRYYTIITFSSEFLPYTIIRYYTVIWHQRVIVYM